MWAIYALLSAVSAALVAIFGKVGLQQLDSTLATAIRAVVMAAVTLLAALTLGKFKGFTWNALAGREWLWITLAGLAGAMSWLFYFYALKTGPVTPVAVIDRLSIVFVFVFAVLFLGDAWNWRGATGVSLIVLGALLVSLKAEQWHLIGKTLLPWLVR